MRVRLKDVIRKIINRTYITLLRFILIEISHIILRNSRCSNFVLLFNSCFRLNMQTTQMVLFYK